MANFWALLSEPHQHAITSIAMHRRFPAGAILLREGETSRDALVLRTGRVKIVASGPGGHDSVLAVRGPGDIVGEMAAIDESPRSATVASLDPVTAYWLPAAPFARLLDEYPAITLALLKILTARLRMSSLRQVEHGNARTANRLAALLVNLVVDHGVSAEDGIRLAVPLSQTDLAGLIGASREAVAIALKALRDKGIVSTGRQRIVVHDLAGLQQAAAT